MFVNQQPMLYPTDDNHIAFVCSLLTGRALEWATAVWNDDRAVFPSFASFIQNFKEVFQHPAGGKENTQLYNDTQLYISSRPGETHQIEKLTECIVDIKNWMTSNFLLLNSEKTEVLIIGPKNPTCMQQLEFLLEQGSMTTLAQFCQHCTGSLSNIV